MNVCKQRNVKSLKKRPSPSVRTRRVSTIGDGCARKKSLPTALHRSIHSNDNGRPPPRDRPIVTFPSRASDGHACQFAVPVQTGCVLVVALTTSWQDLPASCGCVAVTVICVGVDPVIVNTTPGLPTKFMVAADSVPLA